MKFIFCSNYRGQTGTTTNMLSAAVLSDILFDKKSILLQTQARQNQLEIPLLDSGKRRGIAKKEIGIDSLISYIMAGECTKELFNRSCISLINSSIHFIPGSNAEDMEQLEDSIAGSLCRLLGLAEELYGTVFLDAGVMPEKLKEILYKEADLMIICLNQNKRVLDDFFSLGHMNKKTVYIIGGFDKYSVYGEKQLIKAYPKLREDNTFFIPYNTDIRDAVSKSDIFTYFYRNIACDRTDINYEFVQSVLKLARYLNQ